VQLSVILACVVILSVAKDLCYSLKNWQEFSKVQRHLSELFMVVILLSACKTLGPKETQPKRDPNPPTSGPIVFRCEYRGGALKTNIYRGASFGSCDDSCYWAKRNCEEAGYFCERVACEEAPNP